MEFGDTFGEILRLYRTRKNISQEALAEKSGLDRTYISLLERGKRVPTLKTLFLLASALSSSPVTMVEELVDRLNENHFPNVPDRKEDS